jgi:hypothetical protein
MRALKASRFEPPRGMATRWRFYSARCSSLSVSLPTSRKNRLRDASSYFLSLGKTSTERSQYIGDKPNLRPQYVRRPHRANEINSENAPARRSPLTLWKKKLHNSSKSCAVVPTKIWPCPRSNSSMARTVAALGMEIEGRTGLNARIDIVWFCHDGRPI